MRQTDTNSQAQVNLDDLFHSPAEGGRQPCFDLFRVDGNIFTVPDVEAIERLGVTVWAVRQGIVHWDDMPLNWKALPGLLRSTILADAIETLGLPVRYAIPFRHLGRVLTVAVLPATREPIVVQRSTREPVADRPEQVIFRDPPVPFLTLGLAPRQVLELHAQIIRQILQENDSTRIAPAHLTTILLDIARTGEATCSEVFYYLTQLRALVSGAWRQVRENYGLMSVEYLARQSTSDNPIQAQLLAEAHLLDGRPIEWSNDDPLRVTIKA